MPGKTSELTATRVQRIDGSGMRNLLVRFPQQIEDAVRIGQNFQLNPDFSGVSAVVVTGLGGSAIAGDLLRSYLSSEIKLPLIVNRHYFLPEFVAKNSLVVVSSYSGNTEETVAAHREAIERGAKILCIASGGEIEKLAKLHKNPLVKIPEGFPPRAALAYSFFPLLMMLAKVGIIKAKARDIGETVALLKKKAKVYSNISSASNNALAIATWLKGKLPVVYSATEYLDSVNLRWRTQLEENAKVLAFGNLLPEMNHNELVGWSVLKDLMRKMSVIFLRDRGEHPRVKARIELTRKIVAKYTPHILEVKSEGHSPLARMFSLIYLGDWVSYYLALFNGVDPTPVRVIDYLKGQLAKV
jgi:glucose/mannose-6-phosphate isomerase